MFGSPKNLDIANILEERREIIEGKPFLRKIYYEWYERIVTCLPAEPGPVLEVGSGGGFFSDYVPGVFASDIQRVSTVDFVFDAAHGLPVRRSSLCGVVMTNVLHHVSDAHTFFDSCSTSLRSGGKLVMIEPWNTRWSRFVYRNMHHEPFDTKVSSWYFNSTGPLSDANGALPWIIFERDREFFERRHPEYILERTDILMPFTYLISGGFTARSFLPAAVYPFLRWVEQISGLDSQLGLFALIVLRRL